MEAAAVMMTKISEMMAVDVITTDVMMMDVITTDVMMMDVMMMDVMMMDVIAEVTLTTGISISAVAMNVATNALLNLATFTSHHLPVVIVADLKVIVTKYQSLLLFQTVVANPPPVVAKHTTESKAPSLPPWTDVTFLLPVAIEQSGSTYRLLYFYLTPLCFQSKT
jgi:hypothetical protein